MSKLGKNLSFTLLIATLVVLAVFLGFDVSAKAPPAIPAACNLNYTEITPFIVQMLIQAQPLPQNYRIYEPKMLDERYALFMISDYPGSSTVTYYNYYLYDSGNDGLWLTNDDRAIFITNNTVSQAPASGLIPELRGMLDESSGTTRFYWSFYRYQNLFPVGSSVYSCTLSQGNCIQRQTVLSMQNVVPEIIDLVPVENQNRIYMVIADDTSWPELSGKIYSCSMLPLNSTSLPNDHCSYGYSNFTNHRNYDIYSDNIKGKGIIYYLSNPQFNNAFFDVSSQTSISLPANILTGSKEITLLNGVFFTFRRYISNPNLIDFYLIGSTGQGFILNTDNTGITPLLTEMDSSNVLYVYSHLGPGIYKQFIRRLSSGGNWQTTEIYRGNSNVGSPMPLTVTNDGKIIAIKATPILPVVRLYKSNCSG